MQRIPVPSLSSFLLSHHYNNAVIYSYKEGIGTKSWKKSFPIDRIIKAQNIIRNVDKNTFLRP